MTFVLDARRHGALFTLIGGLLVGIGVLALAFSLGSVSASNFNQTVGSSPQTTSVSVSLSSGAFTVGMLFVGFGVLLRTFGGFLTAKVS